MPVLEKCPVCGAILDEEDLFCANCGTVAPQNKDQQKPPVAHEVTCNFVCKGCGASMSYDARCGALRCPFCGSTELAKQPDAKEIAPEGVVPFAVQQADAIATMRKWLGSSFWRPGDLSEQAMVVSMTPVYVPYWVFQAETHTFWTADSSHTPPGACASWYPASGQHEGKCDGLLVGASSVLTAAETSAICPFDLAPALPPERVDLVNATFERFTVPRKYARPLASQGFEEIEREACRQYVPGKARNLHVNVRITDLTSRPMLLPVWIMAYRYQDRVFRFLANGQIGRATGQAPTSWRKIAAVAVIVAIIVLLLLLLLAQAAGVRSRRFGFDVNGNNRQSAGRAKPQASFAVERRGEARLRFRALAANGILPLGQRPFTSWSEFARSEELREPILQGAADAATAVDLLVSPEEDGQLRPQRMRDMVGQREVYARLEIAVDAAQKRGETLGHILFDGPPGLGKTTFATCIPRDLGVSFQIASGAALSAPKDLIPYLTNAEERSVLFIDEIHRLPKPVEEFLYPAMEDFRIDILLGEGVNARTINMPLRPFTLIGATTRAGMISAPLRDRFHLREHLDFYTVAELAEIVRRSAAKLQVPIDAVSAEEIAGRSRGTPRLANNRLRWVRDYVTSKADGRINLELTRAALAMQGIDVMGLDGQDRKYLETIVRVFHGGPVGVEAIAHTLNTATDTLSDEVEPFLLRSELVIRTPRGRKITPKGYLHLGLAVPDEAAADERQRRLFS